MGQPQGDKRGYLGATGPTDQPRTTTKTGWDATFDSVYNFWGDLKNQIKSGNLQGDPNMPGGPNDLTKDAFKKVGDAMKFGSLLSGPPPAPDITDAFMQQAKRGLMLNTAMGRQSTLLGGNNQGGGSPKSLLGG